MYIEYFVTVYVCSDFPTPYRRLSLSISEGIEVVTIAIDQTAILEKKQ